ncbi:MAG: HNH endonuclease [Actinomycetota bacterium]
MKVAMPGQKQWRECLERDHWRCRYCGSPLLLSGEFSKFAEIIDSSGSLIGGTNLTKHGSYFLHVATIDHIEPRSRGGTNAPDNLVSTCHACNFGKDDFTLGELGLEWPDPERFTLDTKWPDTVERLRTM